jgi:putative acetyltransferase
LQRRGIGTLLVNAGLRALRMRRASGCILVGDPAYYGRFGFKASSHFAPPGHPAEYFMMLGLAAEPNEVIGFHPLFDGA